MNIESIKRVIEEYGVLSSNDDIVRVMRERHSVDVSHIVNPVELRAGRYNDITCVAADDITALENAYQQYRSTRNMSALRYMFRHENMFVFGRASAPSSPLGDSSWNLSNAFRMAFRDRVRDANANNRIHLPVIIDQNTRVIWDSDDRVGDIDHIRIQFRIQTNTGRVLSSHRSVDDDHMFAYNPHSAEYPDDARTNGWQPIRVHGRVIGFNLPANVDPMGKHLIVWNTYKSSYDSSYNAYMLALCMRAMSDRWFSDSDNSVAVPDHIVRKTREMMAVAQFARAGNSRIDYLNSAINTARNVVRETENALAARLREINEYGEELNALSVNSEQRIMTQLEGMLTAADQIREIRPVSHAEVDTSDGKAILKFITHPFGMSNGGSTILRIEPLIFEIDMLADSYARGIVVRGSVSGYPGSHPHGGTPDINNNNRMSPCWGDAGRRPLPEAWADRNWLTLARLLCSWVTQYNGSSPLVHWSYLLERLQRADRTGWLIEEDQPTPTTTPIMMGASA